MTQPHPMTSELLACPFCGNAGNRDPRHTFHRDRDALEIAVRCGACLAIGPFARFERRWPDERGERLALEKWNERAEPTAELNRRTPPAAGQSGWALYPKEPTQAMRDAYDRAPGPGTGWWAWKVMTEAAPPAPEMPEQSTCGKPEVRPQSRA